VKYNSEIGNKNKYKKIEMVFRFQV
jgi:hypothetical protein